MHNNLYYYLDERNTRRLFIDLFIGKRLNNKTIVERRAIVLNHLELHLIDDKEKDLIELAKAAADRKTLKELNDMARGISNDRI